MEEQILISFGNLDIVVVLCPKRRDDIKTDLPADVFKLAFAEEMIEAIVPFVPLDDYVSFFWLDVFESWLVKGPGADKS